jgi:hypothetical protein
MRLASNDLDASDPPNTSKPVPVTGFLFVPRPRAAESCRGFITASPNLGRICQFSSQIDYLRSACGAEKNKLPRTVVQHEREAGGFVDVGLGVDQPGRAS